MKVYQAEPPNYCPLRRLDSNSPGHVSKQYPRHEITHDFSLTFRFKNQNWDWGLFVVLWLQGKVTQSLVGSAPVWFLFKAIETRCLGTSSKFIDTPILANMDLHIPPVTCLTTNPHSIIKDPVLHYSGCLDKESQESYLNSLGEYEKTAIQEAEQRRIGSCLTWEMNTRAKNG